MYDDDDVGRSIEVNGTNYTTRAVTSLMVSTVMTGNQTTIATNRLPIPVQLVFVTEPVIQSIKLYFQLLQFLYYNRSAIFPGIHAAPTMTLMSGIIVFLSRI